MTDCFLIHQFQLHDNAIHILFETKLSFLQVNEKREILCQYDGLRLNRQIVGRAPIAIQWLEADMRINKMTRGFSN